MLPVVPLMWAARAAGHEILVATTSDMTAVGAQAGLPVVDVFPYRDVWQSCSPPYPAKPTRRSCLRSTGSPPPTAIRSGCSP
jgi:hypothetical protein